MNSNPFSAALLVPEDELMPAMRMLAPPFLEPDALAADNGGAVWAARTLAGLLDYPMPLTGGLLDIAMHTVNSVGVAWILLADEDGILSVTDLAGKKWAVGYYAAQTGIPPVRAPGLYAVGSPAMPRMPVHELVREFGPLSVAADVFQALQLGADPTAAVALAAHVQSLLSLHGIRVAATAVDDGDRDAVVEMWNEGNLQDPQNHHWGTTIRAAFNEFADYTVREPDPDVSLLGVFEVVRKPATTGTPASLAAADRILADPAGRDLVAAMIDRLGGELR